MTFIKTLSILLTFMFFISTSWAAPLAGHVILSKGTVNALSNDGTARALKRRSKVFSGDVITTGGNGSVQIRFIDKALMTIKANSEMNIETYLSAKQDSEVKDEKVLMSLVKGGFRTITGTIGKGDKNAYKVNTPAASIGIRGTNYEVQQEADGGFVMGVYSGGIQVENEAGSLNLGSGADFNFTRVKPNSPPKGLLAPPPTLAENNATQQSEEKDEASEENQVASEDDTSDEGEEGASQDDANKEDDQGAALIAEIDDSADSNSSKTESVNDAIDSIANAVAAVDVGSDVNNALDTKLTETIEDIQEELKDSGEVEAELLLELLDAGVLEFGESLDDLDPNLQALIEEWIANPTNIETLLAEIEALQDQQQSIAFDFADPYKGIDAANVNNPFTSTDISDEALALGESGKLAVFAMPVNQPNNYAGDSPALSTLEAQLTSPGVVNFTGFDYSQPNASTHLFLHYTLIDPSTGERTEYEMDINVDFDSTGMTVDDFAAYLANIFLESDTFIYDEDNNQATPVSNPAAISLNYNASKQKFELIPTTGSNEFMIEMELSFNNDGSPASLALMDQLGNGASSDDFWYADSGLDLFIGNGSWDTNSDKPIMVIKETHTHTDPDGTIHTEDRLEIVQKPLEAASTVSSLAGFGSCIDGDQTCDIQVNTVAAADNIRWGAWLAEPGEGIQITQFDVGDNTIDTDSEENIIAFWLAAERADINQLTGSANFTANSDCAQFSQCIGFADDGVVQNLTANFDVNFNTGAITNGNLTLETTEDPDLGLLGGSGAVQSSWNVNFSGQMTTDSANNRLPEFQTSTLNGTVADANGPDSTSVIGNIGGVFVKPGDVFAGGYNLGTTDTNKHAAGVFSMEKTPQP